MERNTQRTGLMNLLALLLAWARRVCRCAHTQLARRPGRHRVPRPGRAGRRSELVPDAARGTRSGWRSSNWTNWPRRKASAALFEAKDAEVFPAQRSREQFERFFVPVFTVFLFLARSRGCVPSCGAGFHKHDVALLSSSPMVALCAVRIVRAGVVPARPVLRDHRPAGASSPAAARRELAAARRLSLLRCCARYWLASWAEFPKADFYVARVLCGLLGLVALETLVNLCWKSIGRG